MKFAEAFMLYRDVSKYSQKIRIGDKIIDQYSKVYFIAEIGINHEGSILRCKKLIKLAKQSNVDVKIQLSIRI